MVRFLKFILLSFYAWHANAVLDILITQGIDSSIPVKLDNCKVEVAQNSVQDGVAIFNQVLRADINHSGLLRLANKNEQADYALECKVKEYRAAQELLTVDLIYQGKQIANYQIVVPNLHYRAAAHNIADKVFLKLTGIAGIFSSKIAYVKVKWNNTHEVDRYILEIADSDGYNEQQVVISKEPIMSPSWSPKGKQLAYVSFESKKAAVKLLDLDTGKTSVLADHKGINGAPAWSHDGKKMALVLSHEKIPKIYILDLETKKLKQITFGMSLDTEPSFSIDDKHLLFTSNRGGSPQIYKYDFATQKESRVTFEGSYNVKGSYSADGKNIVMMHRDAQGVFRIAAYDTVLDKLNILTNDSFAESPSISANGYHIIYATRGKKYGILSEVTIDGKLKWILPAKDGDVQEPAWSFMFG